jgi:hypothetical protein
MLQIILVLAVACVAAYFIATSRKSKVEEISKDTPAPLNPTFDPAPPAVQPDVDAPIPAKVEAAVEVKKPVKKKAAVKKKSTK